MSKAKLHRRAGPHETRELIPTDQWSFDRCPDGKTKTPSNADVCLPAGFSANYIYELTYEASDPMVMGMGFAATRDLVSYLRYDTSDGNPLADSKEKKLRRAGPSVSAHRRAGDFLKDLIYQGFNQDEDRQNQFSMARSRTSPRHAARSRITNLPCPDV